jgi:hypothetical protein
MVAEDMYNIFDASKQDLSSSLPRQFGPLVQQINGETQGKWVEAPPMTPGPGATASQGNHGMLANVSQPGQGSNLNLPKLLNQTMTYGPNTPDGQWDTTQACP